MADPAGLNWIGEIVRRNLTAAPRDIALVFGDREWHWTEFDARVRHNVTGLRAARVPRGDRVAVLGRNHPATLETLFATANSGTVCTLVDWRLTPKEIVYALNRSEARFLFLGHEFEELYERIGIELDTVVSAITVGGPEDEYEGWLTAHETSEGMIKSARDVNSNRRDQPVLRVYSASGKNGPTFGEHTHGDLLTACSQRIREKSVRREDVDVVDVPLSQISTTVRVLSGMAAGAVTTLVQEA
jgi:acyl-CoA synthetase (AMP-forming)/AMP-acid ligase II